MIYEELLNMNPVLLLTITVWVLIWKGWALWISARKSSKVWFVVILVLNTLGILPILYIFFFSKMGKKETKMMTMPKTTKKVSRKPKPKRKRK